MVGVQNAGAWPWADERKTDSHPCGRYIRSAVVASHPFDTQLNAILDAEGFDRFAEDECRRFYAPTMGRPSLEPGRYFRLLLVGYFEGLDAERGYRVACG